MYTEKLSQKNKKKESGEEEKRGTILRWPNVNTDIKTKVICNLLLIQEFLYSQVFLKDCMHWKKDFTMRALYTSHTHHFLLSNNVESSVWKNLANFPYSSLLYLIFFLTIPLNSNWKSALLWSSWITVKISYCPSIFCSKPESQLLIHLKQKLNLKRNKKVALFYPFNTIHLFLETTF